jgi:hypothetical protein
MPIGAATLSFEHAGGPSDVKDRWSFCSLSPWFFPAERPSLGNIQDAFHLKIFQVSLEVFV